MLRCALVMNDSPEGTALIVSPTAREGNCNVHDVSGKRAITRLRRSKWDPARGPEFGY